MSCDSVLADALPLLTETWTGWPQAAEPLSWITIPPDTCWPAEMAACWQEAPDEVAWQVHWLPR